MRTRLCRGSLLIIAPLLLATAASGQSLPADTALHDYESCDFADGLQVATIDALPAGVQERSVDTSTGPKPIRMLAGRRIMLAFGLGGDFFANVKPEVLPADTWAIEKQTLLDELAYLLTSSHDGVPNTDLPHDLHGLEVRGMDRTDMKGGVLGFYLLFDDTHHIATSIYLLNQDPLTRHFQTIAEYRALRDRFLRSYTACIVQNAALRAAQPEAAPRSGAPR